MKTIIKALAIALTTAISCSTFAESRFVEPANKTQRLVCFSEQAAVDLYNAGQRNDTNTRGRLITSQACGYVPHDLRFEVNRGNAYIAELIVYDKAGNLRKDQPIYVNALAIEQPKVSKAQSFIDSLNSTSSAASQQQAADKAAAFLQANVAANPDRRMFDSKLGKKDVVRCTTWKDFETYINTLQFNANACVYGHAPNGFKILEQGENIIIKIQMYTASGTLDPNGVMFTASPWLQEDTSNESFQGD